MIEQVPFSQLDPMLIVISATVLALLMSTFISNTATANLLLPLMAALGSSEAGLQALGGEMMLILVVTFSCSFAMAPSGQYSSQCNGFRNRTPPEFCSAQNGGSRFGHRLRLCLPDGVDTETGWILLKFLIPSF